MRNQFRRQADYRSLTGICALLLLSMINVAVASSFSVSPVKIDLAAETRIVALRIHNNSAGSTAIQAELMSWNQKDGKDFYQPITREILVTPPIFTISPDETQIIRVGLRQPLNSNQELSYRLFLQELPTSVPNKFQGLNMVMRMSLPVFVAPVTGHAVSDLSWHVHQASNGKIIVDAYNRGNGHAQMTELRLRLKNGLELVEQGNTYILPDSKREWSIDYKGASLFGTTVKLVAKVNGNTFTSELRME